jgi:hypothetical protein
MFYRLLGMAVWKGAKRFRRRRYGRGGLAKRSLAVGGVVAAGVGVAAVLLARRGGAES